MGGLLSEEAEQISSSKLAELSKHAASTQRRLKISDARRAELEATINDFKKGGTLSEDTRLAMLLILMHRYLNRTKGQTALFDNDDPEPSRPLVANQGVYEAALLQLLHHFDQFVAGLFVAQLTNRLHSLPSLTAVTAPSETRTRRRVPAGASAVVRRIAPDTVCTTA